ncbi:melatonin receptor type 1B-A-like [Acanthaster planci]|uniref:Melatonin receptor type 1B-A-like n=1 Tax=Acanthaster planci TaxID=133434 RepID=A0A8B7YKA8_ACAPL|nr:melatonin receptor type 1B-A-like [Acanthaster planci]XP_022093695.1 melatonin receptor type 1B-A-like [Acanthaster planci]
MATNGPTGEPFQSQSPSMSPSMSPTPSWTRTVIYAPTIWNPYVNDTATNTWFLCISLGLGLTGTLGNLLVIGSVLVHKPLRRLHNAFIVNLSVADLCVSALIQFATVDALLKLGATFRNRPALCDFFGFLCTTSCTCSLWSITAISINRYVCICHNSAYHRIFTRSRVAAMLAGLWVGCFLMDLPALLGWGGHAYDPKVMFCTFNYTASLSYTIFLVSVGVGTPIAIVTYCYIRILLFVRASRRTLRRLSQGATEFATLGQGRRRIKRRDMALLRTVMTLWVVFLIMWAPYTVYVLFDTQNTWNRTLYVLFVNLCHANSSVNCVIYAATNPTFRRGYVAFLRHLLCLKGTVVAENQVHSRNMSKNDVVDARPMSYSS